MLSDVLPVRPIGKVAIHAHTRPTISDWRFLLIGCGDFFFSGAAVHVLVGSNWIFFCMFTVIYLACLIIIGSFMLPLSICPRSVWDIYLVDWYLADRQLVNITKDGRQGCFQWTNMAHGGSSEFQSLFLFISWSSSLVNIINFWFWALAFIQIFSSKWHCSGMDWW